MEREFLSPACIFRSAGDPSWRPFLEAAARFEFFLDNGPAKSSENKTAAEAHRVALIEAAGQLRRAQPALAVTRLHERWFTEAVLVWLSYRDTASAPLVDTVGSEAAYTFALDLSDAEAVGVHLEAALVKVFEWTSDEMDEMKRKLHFMTSNLRLKTAITGAIVARVGPNPSPETVHAFAHDVFGPLPVRPGDFDLVVTQAAFFMCFPYDGKTPLVADFENRSEVERQGVTDLVKAINRGAMSAKKIRFPAFGFFEPSLVSAKLIDHVEAHLATLEIHAPRAVITETLATMVTILPTRKLDMYLVHDIWGHGWQESLCEFEWIFERLAENAQKMSPFDGADSVPALAAGFSAGDEGVTLDPAAFLASIEADLRRRFDEGAIGVVAECLADLSEYKFINEQDPEGRLMPSSSLLRRAPVKLDLTVQDIQMNQKTWSRPYRFLLGRESARAELRRDLLAGGLGEQGLDEAIDQAERLLHTHFGPAFERGLSAKTEGDGPLTISLGQRLFVAMGLLAATIGDFGDDRERSRAGCGPQWENPTTSVDLLMLTLGWFFDQDHHAHVWQLDMFVVDVIRPLLARLEAAL